MWLMNALCISDRMAIIEDRFCKTWPGELPLTMHSKDCLSRNVLVLQRKICLIAQSCV